VELAFNRRNISIKTELTEFSSKFERLRFAICRDCLGAEIVVRYFQRVEWSGMGVQSPNYLNQERIYSFRRNLKDCVLRFAVTV
jgi:hypothetical protein